MEWKEAETFDDLLKIGIMFINGELDSTPFHGGPLVDADPSIVERLMELHRYKFFTIDGQDFLDVRNELCLDGIKRYDGMQISYVEGIVSKELVSNLPQYISDFNSTTNNKIKFTIIYTDMYVTNIFSAICVTREKFSHETQWENMTSMRNPLEFLAEADNLLAEHPYTSMKNVSHIISCGAFCCVSICASEFGKEFFVEDFLIEYLRTAA